MWRVIMTRVISQCWRHPPNILLSSS